MDEPQKPARRTRFAANWLRAWSVYTEPRVLVILVLGFSAGVPLALTHSTLNLWLREAGVDIGTIGLFALVGIPYVLKFIWAPAVDALPFPLLTRFFGRRRGWLLGCQLLLVLAITAMGLVDPAAAPVVMALAALGVTFVSATQDIVIDAFRIESLDENQYAAGMANYVAAYRIALLASGAGTVEIVSALQGAGVSQDWVWSAGYAAMAALIALCMIAVLLAREPEGNAQVQARQAHMSPKERFEDAVIRPFTEFAQKPDWFSLLLFVLLFKLGDALAGTLMGPFALDIGFEKETYTRIANGIGFPMVLVGGFLGGAMMKFLPMTRSLWIAGILQLLSNLAFVVLALAGDDALVLAGAVAIEQVTGGLGTVVFVAFLSHLCQARDVTATQFALLTALAATGRTVFSAGAGYMVALSGWAVFFSLTALAALPGLLFLAWLQRRGAIESASRAAESGELKVESGP